MAMCKMTQVMITITMKRSNENDQVQIIQIQKAWQENVIEAIYNYLFVFFFFLQICTNPRTLVLRLISGAIKCSLKSAKL